MRVRIHILDHENFIFFLLQISTNVLLVMEVVTKSVSTNQDHSNVNVKKDMFLELIERLALVQISILLLISHFKKVFCGYLIARRKL